MVRLRAGGAATVVCEVATGASMFQFQYGTIKRASEYGMDIETFKFQFQYGTIKREAATSSNVAYGVSIPVWYD